MDSTVDLPNGYDILRIICGLFFIPHVIGKITARDASVNFFTIAGFRNPQFWSYLAMVIEVILAISLVLGILTLFTAYLASVYLLVAAAANFKVSRKWLWHIGGSEWPVFWAICCAIVGYYGTAA